MAISIATHIKVRGGFEISVEECYVKVTAIQGGKEGMQGTLSWFKSKEAIEPFNQTSFNFVPVIDGENFISQAYAHLKNLPEFNSAVDC